jgi:DNA-directed RNA polymerase subunit M/transcription elongation factor TFIIS
MASLFITRVNVKNKLFEILLSNREYSLLPYDKHMELLDNLENVIFLMAEQDFCKNQIRENKAKLYNKYYINQYSHVLSYLEGNNEWITKYSKGIYDESMIYKKELENLVSPKTKEIIIKLNNRKNIKINETFSDIPCKFCGSMTINKTSRTGSIDECDIEVFHCKTCDRRY